MSQIVAGGTMLDEGSARAPATGVTEPGATGARVMRTPSRACEAQPERMPSAARRTNVFTKIRHPDVHAHW